MKPKFGDLYLVRTKSLVGRAIRFWTRSRYSHGGVVVWGGKGVEANWGGVQVVDLSKYDGLEVVYLTPMLSLEPWERRAMSKFLQENLNKGYDYGALFGFLTSWRRLQHPKRWFCFELQFLAYKAAGRTLARLDYEDFIDARIIYGSLALEKLK